MSPLPIYGKKPVVLLTNDDGPPSSHSPNIYSFAKLLIEKLGWDVRVVVPATQNSWVGKGFAITQIIDANYFYPLEPDGLKGEITTKRRPLKEGESMEWVLLSGTPSTCANIALHNIYPGEIDLLISGPNHGRNSSTAFALSSGTIGAALAGALSVPIPGPSLDVPSLHKEHMPCIAVSYGVVTRPVEDKTLELATDVAVDVCKALFDDWGHEGGDDRNPIQLYSVNIPLVESAITKENRKVCFTTMWRNTYGRLFKQTSAITNKDYNPGDDPNAAKAAKPAEEDSDRLRFRFAPNLQPMILPSVDQLPEGSDAWAFAHGYTSVTPIRAEYAGLYDGGQGFGSTGERFWSNL
ncbi:putative tubulin--tyrosine ligase PBY1 [Vanrija pseudolonga]|uniref:Tubulin--tyrosine ligase PBY1 n=1 Tax=Vanrija pseudolonga TaxID=143232 RepID=A0AAF1BEU3_9TREE|nr:putative tubulin--tyrosine ligase PBY1 [Vanrija pseudolonga]